MNKRLLIIIFLILILIVILFAILKLLDRKKSKELELTYKVNAGIPFRWQYEIEDENIVKFVKSYVLKDENTGSKVGAPVYTNYVFKGLKKGKTTITFKYVNFTNKIVSKEEKHLVKVDSKGNISLVEGN